MFHVEVSRRSIDVYFNPFSSKSFASLILLAMYGLPPRSGWFANMILRWASFSLFLVTCDSFKPKISLASFRSILAWNPPISQSPVRSPIRLGFGWPAILFKIGERTCPFDLAVLREYRRRTNPPIPYWSSGDGQWGEHGVGLSGVFRAW